MLGVIVTAIVTGAAAALVFGLPFEQGLLMGAVLSPTDPAILIPLFIGSRLRPKVAQTVVAESAFNDPTGAVLALAIAGALVSGKNSLTGPAADFVGQLALSTAGGVLAGIVLSAAISSRRTGIWRESAAIAVLAVVAIVVRLARLRGRQRLPRRVPRRSDRRQHAACSGFRCTTSTFATCSSRRAASPTS